MTPSFTRSSTRSILLGALLVLLSAGASAQSLRCKGDLAQIGNSKSTVLQKCGEPVAKDSFCRPMLQQDTLVTSSPQISTPGTPSPATQIVINNGCMQVEEWTYNPGYGQFMTMLQFEGGALTSIRYGDRVSR